MDNFKVNKTSEMATTCIEELVKLLEEEAENALDWENKYDEQVSKVDDLENDIADLKADFKELEKENARLQARVDDLEHHWS